MRYDIIIVGAGPSGISTALHLAKFSPELAVRTLVIEKQSHPRPKLCGGGILQDGIAVLSRLGLSLAEIPCVRVKEAYFLFEGRGFCINRYPESFNVVRREEFDAWLVKEARSRGITIMEELCVLNVSPTDQGMKVETNQGDFFCKVVVGADGSSSVVGKVISGKNGSCSATALEIFISPEELRETKPKNTHCAYFDFSFMAEGLQGYVWDFPTQDCHEPARNMGIYNAGIRPSSSSMNLKNMLRLNMEKQELKLDRYTLKGNPIRWFDKKKPFSSQGIILVGDAAGVDPVFGEGISFALGYGELAAAEIKEAFAENDFSFSGYKSRILKHPMGRCLKRRSQIARILYRIRSRLLLRFIWGQLGFLMKWYIEYFLIEWAKQSNGQSGAERTKTYKKV
ncbi:MAG: NAD(P)/FAD-dependent oxidoreductase [Clostridia bacterium]|nr:NAD(P)/FAD-dependent oxidoreductase [Clostridia bacterium]